MDLDTTYRPVLTRFERARCIGARAAQIADGAYINPAAAVGVNADQLAVATAEYRAGENPLVVQRVDGTVDMSDAVELRVRDAVANEITERGITNLVHQCRAPHGTAP
jgi:DNA-directed RNA polymerase subunit K/omega